MSPALFVGKNVIVQGITGTQGTFHTRNMVAYGTNIIAGTSPNKAGSHINGIPVYTSIQAIQAEFTVDASVIFVPAPFAKSAIIEAIDAKVPLIVCITEHIPVHDMLAIRTRLAEPDVVSTLIGPNSPGVLIPGDNLLGIIPAALALPGDTAIVSRSGTLTYEAMDLLTKRGIGQKYVLGIGGDMIHGIGYKEALALFEQDPSVKRIVMIGEIGGTDEIDAGDYVAQHVTKPVYGYIAGHSAPVGVQLGHAGAILGTNTLESAQAKTAHLKANGVFVADSINDLIASIK